VPSHVWAPTGEMAAARAGAAATLLTDGRVLVTGGVNGSGVLATAERYSPDGGTFLATPPMQFARAQHTSTLLRDGRVLIAGGVGGDDGAHIFDVVDIYDAKSNTIAAGATMGTARTAHSATTLLDGNVLVAGGIGAQGALQSTEIYYPALNAFQAANPLLTPRSSHHA